MPSNSASVEGALSLWEAFHHQNEQDEYPLYHSHSAHNVTLRCIQNLNGFSIGIFCSHSAHKVTLRHILRLPTSVGLAPIKYLGDSVVGRSIISTDNQTYIVSF